MARVELETYYKHLFKDAKYPIEQLKQISSAHVISTDFYDVQFGRNSLIYRDKDNKLNISIEHDLDHKIIIYLNYFYQNTSCSISFELLAKRISKCLDFLNTKYFLE